MDISHPVFLGSSYSGDVKDLPGHRRDEANDQGAGGDGDEGGDASVKDVINLLERVSAVLLGLILWYLYIVRSFQVEQEFGIATARVGERVKDVREEIVHIKRQRQRQWRKVRRVEERI